MFGAVLEYVIVILHHEKKLKEQNNEKDTAEVEMVPLRHVSLSYFNFETQRECMLLENSKKKRYYSVFFLQRHSYMR